MTKRFEHIFESATANKKQFDVSVSGVRESLQSTIIEKNTSIYSRSNIKTNSVGWLRGSFSYPWAIVLIVIPAVLDVVI